MADNELETKTKQNPDWTADEHILALSLYMKHRGKLLDDTHPDVVALSQLLNAFAQQNGVVGKSSFRNPNGVAMKLANFSRLDPIMQERGLSGLSSGSKNEKVIWDAFAAKVEELGKVANSIEISVFTSVPGTQPLRDEGDLYEVEAEEGGVLTKLHQTRERNRALVKSKREQILSQNGRLACEACGFDFVEHYGERGYGFIEVHHVRPLHTLTKGSKTKLDDLAVVCSNCHRMIHTKRPWLTMEQLREVISANRIG